MNVDNGTVFVIVSDPSYWVRATNTIRDIRGVGRWGGDVLIITLDNLKIPEEFRSKYNLMVKRFEPIDKSLLLEKIGGGFLNSDKRELYKLNQWEKLHVFDEYFSQWKRVIYMDSGLRVLDSVEHLLSLEYENSFLCPNDCGDGPIKQTKRFSCQLDFNDPSWIECIKAEFGQDVLTSEYFLNCMWIYDTNILKTVKKTELLDVMNGYPICRTNEMGVMNLVLHFKYGLWKPFPYKANNGKFLFEWCELNNPGTVWSEYCFIKYPVTI